MKHLGKFVFGCIASVFNAWVVTMLFAWFAIPAFGLAPITVPAVFGLSLLINTFSFNPYRWTFNEKDRVQASIEIICVSATALGAGFCIHWFM